MRRGVRGRGGQKSITENALGMGPSPPLPAVHPQPDTHTQPAAQHPPNIPLSAPHSMLPSVPGSYRQGKGSDQPQHSWVPTPCPVDTCTHTHTHTHTSHANSSSRPLPPTALAPARNGQLAVCLSAPSICPLEKTELSPCCLRPGACTLWNSQTGFSSFLSIWGKEPSGLLRWPTGHAPQGWGSHSPPGPGRPRHSFAG